MRFAYFDRLSSAEKRIYLRSDELRSVKVPDALALAPLVEELRTTLEAGRRVRATKAANALVRALCNQLGAPKVRVRIHETRPSWDGGELHGLYTFALEAGEVPEIEVWMRTVAKGQVVKFRTFLRTLLHEVCHHLDATIFEMKESFHTHGFFARESSLAKQLLGERPKKPTQLDLFGGNGSAEIRSRKR
jgi:hypothetical protein